MEPDREQLALDQIGLGRLAQADGDVGRAHRQIELLVGGEQGEMHIRIELHELPEPRGEPVHPDARSGGDAQLAVRPLARIGQLRPRRLELHEDVMRGVVEELALLGEDEPAGVAMKQRDAQLLLERGDLPRYSRLREPERLAGVGEAARLGSGVKHLQLVPVHAHCRAARHSAAIAGSASPFAARKRSASSAAMHPCPAAVTAWR